jgi:hypothetical protein
MVGKAIQSDASYDERDQ